MVDPGCKVKGDPHGFDIVITKNLKLEDYYLKSKIEDRCLESG